MCLDAYVYTHIVIIFFILTDFSLMGQFSRTTKHQHP